MAWTASAIFRQYIADILDNTTAMDIVTDANVKAALYDNDITPDRDVAAASSAYNTGVWAIAGNEVSDAAEWAAGGVNIASRAISTPSTGVVMFDGADTASGASATLLTVFGCLVYDDTITTPVADQGVSYHYFGGTQSVTDGTFTIVWHANGLFRITV